MFPLRDTLRSTTRPWMCIALIALNAAVFAFELTLEPRDLESFVQHTGLTPASYGDPRWRRGLGLSPADFWPFFTSLFVHGSSLHVASNLWFLWIFGDNVEERMGRVRFLAFYLACGLAAGLVHVAADPLSPFPAIGASGAVAGVMGAYLRLFPRGKVLALVPPFLLNVPAVAFLGFWLVLQVIGGSVGKLSGDPASGIAFWAHVGGFAAGLICADAFLPRRPKVPG